MAIKFKRRISLRKHLNYLTQALPAYVLFALLKLLPLPAASWLGGQIGQLIGLFHPGTRRAYENLQLALPERAAEHRAIVTGMWNNLGRVIGEYARFGTMMRDRRYVELVGIENLPERGPVVFLTAHLANWEVCRTFAAQRGWTVASIYRPLNNIYLNPLLSQLRAVPGQVLFPKQNSAKELIRFIRAGNSVGLVGDQRLSDGATVPFFKLPALTTTFPALLAVRHGARIVPLQVERLLNSKLRMTIHPVLPVPETGTDQEKIEALTLTINQTYERWIRQNPQQWLWMHDRWRPKEGWPKQDQ